MLFRSEIGISEKRDVWLMAVELKQVPNLRLFQNEMALGLPGDAADTLHNFILCRLPKPETALADAARHHFAKPGKMLRAKMALREIGRASCRERV